MNSYRKKPNNWRNGIFKNINCNSKMNGVTYREVVADPLCCSRVSCSTFHGSIIGILYVHAIDNLIHLPSIIRYSFCYVYFQILSLSPNSSLAFFLSASSIYTIQPTAPRIFFLKHQFDHVIAPQKNFKQLHITVLKWYMWFHPWDITRW